MNQSQEQAVGSRGALNPERMWGMQAQDGSHPRTTLMNEGTCVLKSGMIGTLPEKVRPGPSRVMAQPAVVHITGDEKGALFERTGVVGNPELCTQRTHLHPAPRHRRAL